MLLTITPETSTLYRYIRDVNATYGSETVACLEKIYQRARVLTPDLPANVAFTIKQSDRRAWGHFLQGGFQDTSGTNHTATSNVHEIMISGECLSAGPLQVLQTVLHEAAHVLCAVRNIKDTTRQNRYHNKRFVTAAEELSLTYDDPQNYKTTRDKQGNEVSKLTPHATIGFSNVVLTDSTRELYKEELDMLMSDLPLNKGTPRTPYRTPKVQDKVYVLFPPAGVMDPYRLRVFGPKKYEAQVEFLVPHIRCWSTLTMGVFACLLDECGIDTDKEISKEDTYTSWDIQNNTDFPQEVLNTVELVEANKFATYVAGEVTV